MYADNRRTQVRLRFAKIIRFGAKRLEYRCGPQQLLNTKLLDDVREHVSVHRRQHRARRTWNNPPAIIAPRFVRWNLTVDF